MPSLEEEEIVDKLLDKGLNATSGAARSLANQEETKALITELSKRHGDIPVVTEEHVNKLIETKKPEKQAKEITQRGDAVAVEQRASDKSGTDQQSSTNKVVVSNDVTDHSTCTGEFNDFVALFRDRYEQLSGTLRDRISPRTIGSLTNASGGVTLVGAVNDVRPTSKGNRLLEIEDTTGRIRVVASGDLITEVEQVVTDEVLGVEGRLSDDGGVVFADQIHHPDVPPRREPRKSEGGGKAVLISDLHVGSKAFQEDRWEAFTGWLEGTDTDYLLVAGDLVEGVGVYPGQQKELTIVDVYEQYSACADHFRNLPTDLEVIVITGNHDSVRLAEPQPALPQEFREPFPDNVRFAGNPSLVDVEGVKILMYHGTSLNAFVEEVPNATVKDPVSGMRHMLRKRHLAPMYGKVRLAPEKKDYLVIDEIPDILHCGHLHTVGAERYNSVTMVNTGAWQSQTEYQKAVNIEPDVGFAAVLDLKTHNVTLKEF